MTRRLFWITAIVLGLLLAGPLVEAVHACPMCREALEADDLSRPRAYMYSILFMLSVPAMLVAGFGIGFYRLSQQQAALNEELSDCLMRRWADAREIALPILWLASDEASYVTAANFMIDGGRPVR
jgi:NAD(P)-dependent dehydrogenase (short-subunit alcohol dehydrogenase family)